MTEYTILQFDGSATYRTAGTESANSAASALRKFLTARDKTPDESRPEVVTYAVVPTSHFRLIPVGIEQPPPRLKFFEQPPLLAEDPPLPMTSEATDGGSGESTLG